MSARALFTVVLLAASCSGARPSPGPQATPSVSDAELGLSKGSVFEVPTPPAVKQNQSAPGELPALPRMYAVAPPRIPHAIDDFVPITREQNMCLGCHVVKEKKPGEPTPIPASHYLDLRWTPEKAGPEIAGARWVCVSCHVPRTAAEPLAGSAAERPQGLPTSSRP